MFFITFVSFVKSCAEQIWLWEREGGEGTCAWAYLPYLTALYITYELVGPPYNNKRKEGRMTRHWDSRLLVGANQCWPVLGYFVNHCQSNARIKEPPVPGGWNKSNSKNCQHTKSLKEPTKNRWFFWMTVIWVVEKEPMFPLSDGYLACSNMWGSNKAVYQNWVFEIWTRDKEPLVSPKQGTNGQKWHCEKMEWSFLALVSCFLLLLLLLLFSFSIWWFWNFGHVVQFLTKISKIDTLLGIMGIS